MNLPRLTQAIDGNVAEVPIVAADHVIEALAKLGRTEDVRFSPDFRRMAIAGYGRSTCMLLDVEIRQSAARPELHITDFVELHSNDLNEPHGFDFPNDNTLVVANRAGLVVLFRLPKRIAGVRSQQMETLKIVRKGGLFRRIASPGSVCVSRAGRGSCEILVCNNYSHRITRHVIGLDRWPRLPLNSLLLENGLNIPDGIAVSPGKRWIAISNHMTRSVLMFDRRSRLTRSSAHVGALHGVSYPHGLRFSPDGNRVFVADAGTPYVHIYQSPDGQWAGDHSPLLSVKVLDDDTFAKGRHNPEEGGPKGLDICARGEIVVVTNEERPLACFHIPSLLAELPGQLSSTD